MEYLAAHLPELGRSALFVVVLLLTWLLVRFMHRRIIRFLVSRGGAGMDPAALTKYHMIERLGAAILLLLGLGLGLYVLDSDPLRRLGVGLFASAGVAGIVLGMAAQNTVANLVAGVIIAFVQPLRLGDRVGLGGDFGCVEEIGLFYTTIRTWDNRRLVIPNKLLSNEVIRNHTLVDARMPAVVVYRLGAAPAMFGEQAAPACAPPPDAAAAKDLLLTSALAQAAALEEPPPAVIVRDADEKGTALQLTVWAADEEQAWRLALALGEAGLRVLSDNGLAASGFEIRAPDPGAWAGAA